VIKAITWPRATAVLAASVAAVLAGPANAAQPQPWEVWTQPAGSPYAGMVHRFNDGIMILMAVVVVFVLALLVIVMLRFNARSNPTPSKTSHNTLIEVVWTIVPILILVGIAVPSFSLLIAAHDPSRIIPNYDPAKVITIMATGNQWYWSYEYPDHGDISFDSLMLTDAERTDPVKQPRLLAVDNELVVPTGVVVRMQVIGADVIHSFAVPSLGFKIDAIPGRLNETWFEVDREGVYYGQCSELCGRDHAFMPIAIHAVSPDRFATWVASAKTDLDSANKALAEASAPAATVVAGN
jgi:cytochrome c oxidase subunit 2